MMSESNLKELKEIKNLFDAGALEKAVIFDRRHDTWNTITIGFLIKKRSMVFLRTQRSKTDIKDFKSLEAAANAIQKIGFKEYLVKIF